MITSDFWWLSVGKVCISWSNLQYHDAAIWNQLVMSSSESQIKSTRQVSFIRL